MNSRNVSVLIVEDSPLMRAQLRTTLQTLPERLTLLGEAVDGQEALQLACQLRPDVILMDIGMPILDGIQATQRLRQACPESKVIILTSHEGDADVLDAFRAGATSYCLKETSPDLLCQIIFTTAGGACWIDPKIAQVLVRNLQPIATQKASLTSLPEFLLTDRERDVLKLITEGQNNTEIAHQLCISLNTVKTHVKNIFQKLDVEDRTAAALKALKEQMI